MRILALDLSTKSSGFCIFNDKQLQTYGCITASSQDVVSRIQKIVKELYKVIQSYPDISKVIVEEVRPQEQYGYGVGNQHTQKVLMWLQAALVFMLHDNYPNIEIEYIYPSSWRAACGIHTGRGIKRKELKTADINFVKNKYNISVNDDIADAIGIGYAYINNSTNNEINWE